MSEGLEHIVAASTRLSEVDGEAGRLTISGYAVDDLAPAATFEEVAYLLLNARLPAPDERVRFGRELAARRELPRVAIDVLRGQLRLVEAHIAASKMGKLVKDANVKAE